MGGSSLIFSYIRRPRPFLLLFFSLKFRFNDGFQGNEYYINYLYYFFMGGGGGGCDGIVTFAVITKRDYFVCSFLCTSHLNPPRPWGREYQEHSGAGIRPTMCPRSAVDLRRFEFPAYIGHY